MGTSHKGKDPALVKIIEAAHQIDTRHEEGARAMKAILMAVAEARISARPKLLDTAPMKASTVLLLYCPTQEGWQTGKWDPKSSCWVSNLNRETLYPTHWTDVPEEPVKLP
jgi:hypothetical protein